MASQGGANAKTRVPFEIQVEQRGETALVCRIEASEPGQLEGLKGALARHLDRFAFREAPLAFDWKDAQ